MADPAGLVMKAARCSSGPVSRGYRSTAKKLEVVPEDAALVQKFFADYLRLGSIGKLAASLDWNVITPRPRKLSNGY
jgi:site-specific DNA recombinase